MENRKSKIVEVLNTDLSRKLNYLDLSISFKELALLLKSDITTAESVRILTTTAPNGKLQKIFQQIYDDLLRGNDLSASFENTGKFDEFLITLIKSGENSEKLYEVLIYLSEYYEKKYRIKQKIISIMTYPIILIVITIMVLTFLLINVIPMFVEIFEDGSMELPQITKILIYIVEFLQSYYIFMIIGFLFFGFIILFLRKIYSIRLFFSKILFTFPYIKNHYRNFITSVVARNLTVLLQGNVNIIEGLEILKNSSKNLYLINHIEYSIKRIESGDSISEALKNPKIFNDAFINMIKVGEDSEKIVEILRGATDYYDQKINYSIDKILQMLQPFIIVIIATFIAFIVFAIAIPIFDLSNGINV